MRLVEDAGVREGGAVCHLSHEWLSLDSMVRRDLDVGCDLMDSRNAWALCDVMASISDRPGKGYTDLCPKDRSVVQL
jgi:hypothetical protein